MATAGELEDATGTGSAITSDSWESEDPATPPPLREEAAESSARGKREGEPREGHSPPLPSGQAPQKEGGETEGGGGGGGRPASEEDEAVRGVVWGAGGRAEPEGRCLRRLL